MNLLKIRHFPTLISSLFFSKLGDYAYEVIFVFIVLETTNNDYLTAGMIYFFRFIPFIFFGPIGGWLADNTDIKKNLIYSEIIRFIISAIIYISYINGSINIILLVVSSFFTTIGRSLFQPSFQTFIPTIIENKNLSSANSVIQIIEETSSILGPLLCSLIIFTSDKSMVLIFNSATYFISIIILLNLNKIKQNRKTKLCISGIYKETFLNIRNMFESEHSLFVTIIGSSLCILFTGSVIRFIIPAISIHLGENEAFTSYIFSLMATGTIIGGIIYNKFISNPNPNKLMFFWFIYGVIMLTMSFSSIKLILMFSLILGIFGAFVDITLITTIQTLSKQENIGRNLGTFSTLANTAEALSGITSGAIAMIGITFSFTIMTSLIALIGFYGIILTSNKKH